MLFLFLAGQDHQRPEASGPDLSGQRHHDGHRHGSRRSHGGRRLRSQVGSLTQFVLGHFNFLIFRSRVAKIDSKILSGAKSLESCQLPDLFDSRHSLAVAQATVSSLRERLGQKEETLKRYEGLLKQARTDTEDTVRKLQVPLSKHCPSVSFRSLTLYVYYRGKD